MAAQKTPLGSKSDKLWRDAIMRAVKRQVGKGGGKYLEVLADKLVALAADGDVGALKEIGDRLDGKPSQAVSVGGDDGGPVRIKYVVEN